MKKEQRALVQELNKPQFTMRQAKEMLNRVPEELLDKPLMWWGEEEGGFASMQYLDEDWINPSGESVEPKSVYTDEGEDMDDEPVVYPKGTVIVDVFDKVDATAKAVVISEYYEFHEYEDFIKEFERQMALNTPNLRWVLSTHQFTAGYWIENSTLPAETPYDTIHTVEEFPKFVVDLNKEFELAKSENRMPKPVWF